MAKAATQVPITTGLPRPTQAGAIRAALILCPNDCHKKWVGRCNVCARLEVALRDVETRP